MFNKRLFCNILANTALFDSINWSGDSKSSRFFTKISWIRFLYADAFTITSDPYNDIDCDEDVEGNGDGGADVDGDGGGEVVGGAECVFLCCLMVSSLWNVLPHISQVTIRRSGLDRHVFSCRALTSNRERFFWQKVQFFELLLADDEDVDDVDAIAGLATQLFSWRFLLSTRENSMSQKEHFFEFLMTEDGEVDVDATAGLATHRFSCRFLLSDRENSASQKEQFLELPTFTFLADGMPLWLFDSNCFIF
jgi:hypothetical protein